VDDRFQQDDGPGFVQHANEQGLYIEAALVVVGLADDPFTPWRYPRGFFIPHLGRPAADALNLRQLFEKVRTTWAAAPAAADRTAEVAEKLQIPAAVVVAAVRDLTPAAPTPVAEPPVPIRRVSRGPDWSYQDLACQRCLDSLRGGPGRKVGLVVPTGGGKTRIALRVALRTLEQYPTGRVVWITHLHNLRTQARRDLQRTLRDTPQSLPANAADLIDRIDFVMVSRLPDILADRSAAPLLVIVDEAHYAAAESYSPLRNVDPPVRGLFLTATPNRTDDLPIGIDEIAFTITYQELFSLGVILMPKLRELDAEFDWSEEKVADLADNLLEHAGGDYQKSLVVCPSISRVNDLYQALLARLVRLKGHVLNPDDIAYVHSLGRSHGETTEDCLADFAGRPMGIMVSAQMLLEGHDDPTVNTVVMTTRTESLIKLMQAAGRCVRTPRARPPCLWFTPPTRTSSTGSTSGGCTRRSTTASCRI
jgi:superfamily II DNA or RNA helicase